jgi:methylglutaconyl-CoA hydratase
MKQISFSSEGGVHIDIEKKIARVTFFHPSSNALPKKVLSELAEQIIDCGKNEHVSIIILQSYGNKAFCAGASFDELSTITTSEEGLVFFSGFANVINAIRTCGKIVIGRIQGKAVGGGVGLASAVDYCFAMETAAIKLSELAVGIGPFVIGPAVERKAGISAFSQMALKAHSFFDAKWAKERGIYAEIYNNLDEMDFAINAFAEVLVNSNPEALSELKKIFWQGTENWNQLLIERAKISGTLVLSDFTIQSIQKFKQK